MAVNSFAPPKPLTPFFSVPQNFQPPSGGFFVLKFPLKVKYQNRKGDLSALFTNERYLTRGINAEISPVTQLLLWELIDEQRSAGNELDHLQVFRLKPDGKQQKTTHAQEQPPHEHTVHLLGPQPVIAKIYVIDDGDHTTMLLAEEY